MAAKTERLVIRCDRETFKKFKMFVVERGYRDYEEALNDLLDKYMPRRFI